MLLLSTFSYIPQTSITGKQCNIIPFVQHDCTHTKTVDCTDTDKRVNLQIGTSYCKQSYRERPGTRAEKLDGIKKS
eukprot:scaffold46988_cov91-Cyclotella_meneghiniana.AAC.5